MKKRIILTLSALFLISGNFAFAYEFKNNAISTIELNKSNNSDGYLKIKTDTGAPATPEYCTAQAKFKCWKYTTGTVNYDKCIKEDYDRCMDINKS